jgi:class 3 adenylate cyclase
LNEGVHAALPAFWEAHDATVTRAGTGSHWPFSPDIASALAHHEMEQELEQWTRAIGELTDHDASPHNKAAYAICQAFLMTVRRDFPSARSWFHNAIELYRAMPAPARESEAWLGIAEAEGLANSTESSVAAARAAVDVARRIGANRLVVAAQKTLNRFEAQPVLATVLFTDIVGSTQRAAELGDRRWHTELERHNTLAGREIDRYGGRLIKSTGDGLLATFDGPARAIRCALELTKTLDELNISIRSGLHTGEIELSGNDIAGIAVHIGARVASLAGPREVLVSRTVADLVTGSGLHFVDRGEHELKGVPGSWRLFAVEG